MSEDDRAGRVEAEFLKLWTEARELYVAQKWDEAIARFNQAGQLLSDKPGELDGPCEVFIERCERFKEHPPKADWDGSWKMDSK